MEGPQRGGRLVGPLGLYYGAKFVAQVAQNLLFAALFVAAGTSSSSAMGLSGLLLASLLPGLLFGIVGGGLVDRVGASRGYVLGAVLRLLPVIAGLAFLGGGTSVWLIAFAYSAASQVFSPAEMALVDRLQHNQPGRAHSLLVALQYGGQAVGVVLLAPALYFVGGSQAILLGSALLFVAVTIMALGLVVLTPDRPLAVKAHLRDAFRFGETCRFFVDHAPARYAVVATAIKTTVMRGIVVALPLYLSHDLGLQRNALVFLLAPGVVGAVLAMVVSARGLNVDKAHSVMRKSVAGMIVGVFALAVFDYGLRAMVEFSEVVGVAEVHASMNTGFIVALPASFLLGFSMMGGIIAPRVVLTASAPAGQQARVFAVQDTLTESMLIVPLLLTGIGTEVVGARATLAAIGLVGIAAVAVLELPRFRHIPAMELEPQPVPVRISP